jgi:hypothetical protein
VADRSLFLSRRRFIRVTGQSTGVTALAGALGCYPAGEDDEDTDLMTDRPILTQWADDIVRVGIPFRELPVAYVSMALRKVFVDPDFRDRASWLLRAHISVSTWHWRIPLPDDRDGVPIAPGDEEREFEELPIREWDPSMPPAMDDIRLCRGRRVTRRILFDCVELAGVRTVHVDLGGRQGSRPLEVWLSRGPLDVDLADGSVQGTVREDFRILGTALRFTGRTCRGAGDVVQLVGWAGRLESESPV